MDLEVRRIETDLGRVAVRVGGAHDGDPMLFWPSLLMDGTLWSAQADHFGPAHRVVLVDPPGHGGSEPLRADFDFGTCARVVVQLLDGLGLDRVHLVGNSWGAMIGVTVAASYPDRIRTAVLMNGTASPAGRRQKAEYGALLVAARVVGFRGPLVKAAVDAFTGPTSRRDRPQVTAEIRAAVGRLDTRPASHAVRSVVSRRPDQRPSLERIAAPVLVVAGREDATFPVAETRVVADGIPGAEFVVVEDGAHLLALEVPDRTNALIADFLRRREVA